MSTGGRRPAPPFRLLAITPPTGDIDLEVLHAWGPARSRVGLAVLLRQPGDAPRALLSNAHRLGPLRRACARAEIPCVLSVHPNDLASLPPPPWPDSVVGVQLRADPSPSRIATARARLGPAPLIGRSGHGAPPPVPEADYTVLAPIYAPNTRTPGRPAKIPVGLDPLRTIARQQPHVFALGGITAERAPQCLAAGAFGLAAIRSFFGPAPEVAHNILHLVDALTRSPTDAPATR